MTSYPVPPPWSLRESPTGTLRIENSAGQLVCTFYSATASDRANAEFICMLSAAWSHPDALRTRIVALSQLYSTTDSIDSPQPEAP